MAEDDPNENKIPTKTETPWNIGESEPGRYGNIMMKLKAYTKNLTMLKVGLAQSE
jgi:hypothetical protein